MSGMNHKDCVVYKIMKCKDCHCRRLGWDKSNPNDYICIGVREPFVIKDINKECSEYDEHGNPIDGREDEEDVIDKFIRVGCTKDIANELIRVVERFCAETGRDVNYVCEQILNLINGSNLESFKDIK